jgi:hypothetical protein
MFTGVSRKSSIRLAACAAVICAGSGCSVPPLDDNVRVSVAEVVYRVKCEIADAVRPHYASYDWFRKWTVQVDLNLIVTDSAGATPSMSFIHPLPNAVLPQISPISQNFTMLVSGNVGATATRNETVSFALAIKDLVAEPACAAYRNTVGLASDLGIREWVDEVFEPIRRGLLTEGVHPAPQSPRGISGIGTPRQLGGAQPGVAPRDTAELAYEYVKSRHGNLYDYKTKNLLYKDVEILNAEIDAIREIVDDPANKTTINVNRYPCLRCTVDSALDKIDLVLKTYDMTGNVAKEVRDALDDLKDNDAFSNYVDFLRNTEAKLKQLKSNLVKASTAVKLDPPIEAIQHQVAFTVTTGGGIGPNWTLARFRGPSPGSGTQNASLLSASRSRANNLSIVLGSPSSQAASGARNAAFIANSIRNALGQ